MKQLLLHFTLLFFSFSFGQQRKLDSLRKILVNQTDRDKIETYINISNLPISRDSAIIYLRNALKISKEIHFDSIYPIQFALAASYYVKGDLIVAKKEIRQGFGSYKFTKDPDGTLGHINMLLGVFNEAINEIDSAKYYYNNVFSKLNDKKTDKAIEVISITYTNYANLYLKSGEYDKAISIYLDSEKMSQKIGDKKNQLISLNNVASCFKEIEKYDKALEYYNTAMLLAKEINNIQNIGNIQLGMGEVYMEKKEYDKALNHFIEAEKILESIDFKSNLSIAYQGLAEVYLVKNNLLKAAIYSSKAMNTINSVSDDFSKVSILLTNAQIHELNNENNLALKRIDEALYISKKNSYLNLEKECLIKKIHILKLQHRTNLLPLLYEDLLVIKDSLLNNETMETITDIETKYQTELKEKENLQLKAEKAEQAELIALESKRKWQMAGGMAMAFVGLGVFGFYHRRNKKQKTVIENLQKELHHRVKNNLAIIDTFIEVVKDEFDSEAIDIKLTELQNRIDSINEVHKQLYASNDVTNLNLKKYIDTLANNVQQSFHVKGVSVEQHIAENIKISPEKSFPMGLIVNEFLTNSYKYAFNEDGGKISIKLEEIGNKINLSLSDNGKGLPNNVSLENANTFGLRIMKLLTEQLKGNFKLSNNNGVTLFIEFPK